MNFFARYPPIHYSAKCTGASIPLTRPKRLSQQPSKAPSSIPAVSTASTTSAADLSAPTPESPSTPPPETPSSAPPSTRHLPPNPFLPWRNPETNRWRAPKFSLRRQADLVKLAQKYGVEPLLPPGRKSSAFKEARILEIGLRVRGTGEGQKVKGHKWERRMPAKLEARRKAMEGMPEMIRLWKQVSLTLAFAVEERCGIDIMDRLATEEDGRSTQNNSGSRCTARHTYTILILCNTALCLMSYSSSSTTAQSTPVVSPCSWPVTSFVPNHRPHHITSSTTLHPPP